MEETIRSNSRFFDHMVEEGAERQLKDSLRQKLIVVGVVLAILSAPTILLLYFSDTGLGVMTAFAGLMLLMIGVNVLFYLFPQLFEDIRLAVYVTIVGMYLLSIGLIVELQDPSVFTMLFLSFAIISIYQELRTNIVNSAFLFVIGSGVLFLFPEVFNVEEGITLNTFYLFVFLLLFVALLSLAFFIILKRRLRIYTLLAQAKEREYRTMEWFFNVRQHYTQQPFDARRYYEQMKNFSASFCKGLGVEGPVFQERIAILEELGTKTSGEVLEKYPDYTEEEIAELKQLELDVYKKMRYIGLQLSQRPYVELKRPDVISGETPASLDHRKDSYEVKIVAFAAFYAYLKVHRPYRKRFSMAELYSIMESQAFEGVFPETFIKTLKKHQKAFERVMSDIQGGEGEN